MNRNRIVFLVCMIFVFGIIISIEPFTFASAEQILEEDGLAISVSTDKEVYEPGEVVSVSVNVDNLNDFAVSDVEITTETPNWAEPASGTILHKQTLELQPKTALDLKSVFKQAYTSPANEDKNEEKKGKNDDPGKSETTSENEQIEQTASLPETGDTANIYVYLGIIAIIAVLIVVLRKKPGIFISVMILCMMFSSESSAAYRYRIEYLQGGYKIIHITLSVKYGDMNEDIFVNVKYNITKSDYIFEDIGNGKARVIGYVGTSLTLNIPSMTPEGKTVTAIGPSAFSKEFSNQSRSTRFNWTSVTIPDTIKEIEPYAFAGTSSLRGDLIIPSSVEIIGSHAFTNTTGFDGKLELSNGLKVIDDAAFRYSGFTGNLTIPDSVESIGWAAFEGCKFNGQLALSKKLKEISSGAFAMCKFTGQLDIPYGVVTIGNHAFTENNFTSLNALPNSVTKELCINKLYISSL